MTASQNPEVATGVIKGNKREPKIKFIDIPHKVNYEK